MKVHKLKEVYSELENILEDVISLCGIKIKTPHKQLSIDDQDVDCKRCLKLIGKKKV